MLCGPVSRGRYATGCRVSWKGVRYYVACVAIISLSAHWRRVPTGFEVPNQALFVVIPTLSTFSLVSFRVRRPSPLQLMHQSKAVIVLCPKLKACELSLFYRSCFSVFSRCGIMFRSFSPSSSYCSLIQGPRHHQDTMPLTTIVHRTRILMARQCRTSTLKGAPETLVSRRHKPPNSYYILPLTDIRYFIDPQEPSSSKTEMS